MGAAPMTALCASGTRLARTETECRPTTQMENQTSYFLTRKENEKKESVEVKRCIRLN